MGKAEKINVNSVWYKRHVLKIADGDSEYIAVNGVAHTPIHRLNLWRKFISFIKRLFTWN